MTPRLFQEPGALAQRVRAVVHSRHGIARGAWLAARLAAGGLAAILLVFHAWLLWRQLDSGQLLDPLTAAKWTAALALVGGLAILRVSGVPLFRGRQALVIWTLVALVHWGAANRVGDMAGSADSQPAGVTLALPAAEILTGLALAVLALTRRNDNPTLARVALVGGVSSLRTLAGYSPEAPSRAPPPLTV